MLSERTLQWVQQNRRRRVRVRPVGESVVRIIERAAGEESPGSGAVLAAINAVVDDAFRENCRVVVERRHGVVINVRVPAMVYSMRIRWQGPLRQAIAELRRGRGRSHQRIRFAYGTDGAPVGRAFRRPASRVES